MSYVSQSVFPTGTRVRDVQAVITLLGWTRIKRDPVTWPGKIGSYFWFESREYRSWTGVELSIHTNEGGQLIVDTRSRLGRSHWDQKHQNNTIRTLKRIFGGVFTTDAGNNRLWHPDPQPPSPDESGCYLSIWRFRSNLIRTSIYTRARTFPGYQEKPSKIEWLDTLNPRIISNNLLVPYLVAVMEDYFKSTFVALLRISPRKEKFLRGARLSATHLIQIAAEATTVEDALSETLPFQRPSAFLPHFATLDPELDLHAVFKHPFRRRKVSLLDSVERLVERRHDLIHRSELDPLLDDLAIRRAIEDVQVSVERCYARICERHGWEHRLS